MTKIATHRSAGIMSRFHRFADIFALWKSVAAAGRDLSVREGTMRKYATGVRPFPAEKFDLLVEKARARPGGEGIDHALVCRIAAGMNAPAETDGGTTDDPLPECFT